MPLTGRLFALRVEVLRGLYSLGFKYWDRLGFRRHSSQLSYRQKLAELKKWHWLMSTVRQKRLIRFVSLRVEESLTLKKLRDEVNANFINSRHLPHLNISDIKKEKFSVNKTFEHHVLCSLNVLPKSRIMSAMPNLRWESGLNCYREEPPWIWEGTIWQNGKSKYVAPSVERHVYVHFIDNIQSIADFKARLIIVMQKIQDNLS